MAWMGNGSRGAVAVPEGGRSRGISYGRVTAIRLETDEAFLKQLQGVEVGRRWAVVVPVQH